MRPPNVSFLTLFIAVMTSAAVGLSLALAITFRNSSSEAHVPVALGLRYSLPGAYLANTSRYSLTAGVLIHHGKLLIPPANVAFLALLIGPRIASSNDPPDAPHCG